MERKIWLKPVEGGKANGLKNISERSGTSTLLECLFLDTADADLLNNNIVLAVCSSPDGLKQVAAIENEVDCTVNEYEAALPPEGLTLSLFPAEATEKLNALTEDKRLLIHFSSVFEQKIRVMNAGDAESCQLIRMLGRFENDDLKGELCAIELKGAEGTNHPTQECIAKISAEAKLERCGSPWLEAMRVKASGFLPADAGKELEKHMDARIIQPLMLQLNALVRAYIALSACAFERTAVHKLRIEARKMLSLTEAYEALLPENARYTAFLAKLLYDTDEARHTDVLEEEAGYIFALNPQLDFSALQQRLSEKRVMLKEDIKAAFARGEYSAGLIELWIGIHAKAIPAPADEAADIAAAVEKVKGWINELSAYKKSELGDPNRVQACRALLRKVRYALENMETMIPRRVYKAADGLKKIQGELGMLCDANQHMKMLNKLAEESGDTEFAYLCGVCAGIFSECRQDLQRKAIDIWKDCRSDIRSLEDAL
jgi:CHAD domain-containing protein